ncbi:tetratricopeptide repeat protein [Lacrimispora sp.]|uniref:tetratricopeptide repeat protein n=1 Tax=Lacrimispora sp. TaxID=2719234 RepID=UPI0034615D0F
MDKYEFNIKVEQIKKLVGKNDYETAMKIADTIDWRRVRNINLLSMVATVYEKNRNYQEAKEILLQAFERAPIGKRLLYKLAELAIKEGNIEEAEAYYKEFGDLASDDPRQQLLRYMILKAKGAPAQQLIHSLESYTSVELDEKWLYELAELYSLAGMTDRCVETCDRIMLMFGLGKYVDKAMDLKIRYAPLTSYQMDLVENRDKYEAKLRAVELEYGAGRRPVAEPEPEEEYYEEEPVEEPEPYYEDMGFQESPMEDDLETSMEEEAVQESIAREMSRISYDEPVMQEAPRLERTRVLEDIRRVGHPTAVLPKPRGIYLNEGEADPSYSSGPIIEEDDIEEPEMEAVSESEYVGFQSAATAEDSEEAFYQPQVFASGDPDYDQPYNQPYESEPYQDEEAPESPHEPSYEDPEDETSWQYSSGQDEALELEELYEEEEDEEIEETPVRNHLMIEARTPEKGLKMAVDALKQIHLESGVKNPVARITGSKLSKRGVLASAEKLAGKDLVIEEAGDLTTEALEELNTLMAEDTSGMIVVLIDNPKQMEVLHCDHPDLASKFECIGSGEEMTAPPVRNSDESLPEREIPASPLRAQKGSIPKASAYKAPAYKEPVYKASPVYETAAPSHEVPEASSYKADYEEFQESYEAPRYENQGYVAESDSWQSQEYEEEAGYEEEEFYEENRPSVRDEEGPGFHGEEMDIDEFAQYACRYANEIDCSVTGKSMLALYERIEIMEEDGLPLNRVNAESLIEEAADRAEKPPLGKRLKSLFSTKYDKEGLLILKEEHFIY